MNPGGGRARSALSIGWAACLASGLLLSACHGHPPPIVAPPPSGARATELQRTIDNLLAGPELSRGTWGIAVTSLTRGDTLYALNARKLLMPASTLKVLTLAAAAERLGWDFRFTSRVLTVGRIEDGTLNGDVIVVGSGDPSIDNWDGAGTALFQSWAERLKAAGIRRVLGRVVGDDRAFDNDGVASGWAWDDLSASYATSVGALLFDQNTARLFVGPGLAVGDPADLHTEPASARLSLVNHATTIAANDSASVQVRRAPFSSTLEVSGRVRLNTDPFVENVSVPNPTLYFVNAMRDALIDSGIDIVGPAVDIDDLNPAPDLQQTTTVAEHASAPLSELAGTMMRFSQNLYAEALLKTLGARAAGVGTRAAGLADVRSVLTRWSAPSDYVMVDGSGLSRYNLTTAETLVAVLAHVFHDERLCDPFLQTLAGPGLEGTLADRMKGTAAAGNLRAKTGSFSNARAIAGFVRTADREPLAFVIVANNYSVSTQIIDRATDAIVLSLAQLSRH